MKNSRILEDPILAVVATIADNGHSMIEITLQRLKLGKAAKKKRQLTLLSSQRVGQSSFS